MQAIQATFDDLGTRLMDVTFVVVDLESTGGSPEQCGITEIGAVKVRGGEVLGEFQTLVNPAEPIAAFISVLTGITDAMVADVFDDVPREGRWGTALLADGNVGISGDPVHLLRRVRQLLQPGGRAVVEVSGPGTASSAAATGASLARTHVRRTRWHRRRISPPARTSRVADSFGTTT